MATRVDFPQDLVDSLRAGQVRLFVGSGPSCAAGLASWDDTIDEMRKTIRRENRSFSASELDTFLATADHLDTAEVFRDTVGSHAYYRFLRSRFRCAVPPSPLHRAIAHLPVNTMFTSNYDRLLESALRSARRVDPAVVLYPEQLNYIQDDECRVIKVHGDIDHPSTIVLTRRDYASYASRHAEFVDALKSDINATTMLFLGFGLRDPNFVRIYNDARYLYDSGKRRSYALMVGTNAVERKMWADEDLTIIAVAKHTGLAGAVAKLQQEAL